MSQQSERRETPWGYEEILWRGKEVTVKILTINAGHRFSLQRHAKRDEHWTVLTNAGGLIEVGDKRIAALEGISTTVPRETLHRITGPEKGELKVLEIAHGQFDQDDIVRVEDDYGRV